MYHLSDEDLKIVQSQKMPDLPDVYLKWIAFAEKAIQLLNLSEEDIKNNCQRIVWQNSLSPDPSSKEEVLLEEFKFQDLVIARLSRSGFQYKMVAFPESTKG